MSGQIPSSNTTSSLAVIKYEKGDFVRALKNISGRLYYGPISNPTLYQTVPVSVDGTRKLKIFDAIEWKMPRTSISPNQPLSNDWVYRLTCDFSENIRYEYFPEVAGADRRIPDDILIPHRALQINGKSLIHEPENGGVYRVKTLVTLLEDQHYRKVVNKTARDFTIQKGELLVIVQRTSRSGASLVNLRAVNACYQVSRAIVVEKRDIFWKADNNVTHHDIARYN